MTGSRSIESTEDGVQHGDIHPMIPTPALRERLKPFVFLDDVQVTNHTGRWGFDFHPHSGVATFTLVREATDLTHADTGGHGGTLHPGGVQWMAAGGGIWHREFFEPADGRVSVLQLWIALPPELENGDVDYQNATEDELALVGNTRVLLGQFGDATSPISTPYALNYFDVHLGPGESWSFAPPQDHDVAWAHPYTGGLAEVPGTPLVVFDRTSKPIEVTAGADGASFVIGTAKQTPWPVVASRGSMHTSRAALARGEQRIAALGRELQAAGRI